MKNKKYIVLGLNYPGHDTSAALLIDGSIVAACEQERFDLTKHSRAFPLDAINECLDIANITIEMVDEIALGFCHKLHVREVYLKPALHDDKSLDNLIRDMDKIKQMFGLEEEILGAIDFKGRINYYNHHECHIASSYYPSGFNESLVVSYDGLGEINTGISAIAKSGKISTIQQHQKFPDSLGLVYAAITFYLGWKPTCDEGIVMGLAPYGDSSRIIPGRDETYYEVFARIIKSKSDFEYEISKDFISYHYQRDKWVSDKFIKYFGAARLPDADVTMHHKNIAAALQKRLEEVVIDNLSYLKNKYKVNSLCISGGVGLNCSLNGKIYSAKLFDQIFIQPASGDSGISIGACYQAYKNKYPDYIGIKNHNSYLGSEFSDDDIRKVLDSKSIKYNESEEINEQIALYLSEGKIIGCFQGGAEFGPRALGNRSILTRPYPDSMMDYVNKKVKFREYFRPFAPAVLYEYLNEYFELDIESPHMLLACKVQEKSKDKIPAVVHVDNSARVQTVTEKGNPKFYNLIKSFYEITKVPVLLNTSFNIKGQPIVNTPEQAIDTFLSTNIDVLYIGKYFIVKD